MTRGNHHWDENGHRASPDDNRRAHLDRCPRCRTRDASYRSFMRPADAASDEDLEFGRENLTKFFETRFADEIRRDRADGWRGRPRNIIILPTLAVAAVLALVFIPPLFDSGPGDITPSGILRDGATPGAARVEPLGGSRFAIAWDPIPEMTEYEIVLYRADQTDICRFSVGDTTAVVVDLADWLDDPGATTVFWRLLGLKSGALYYRSPMEILTTP